jgi:hypothetical protein
MADALRFLKFHADRIRSGVLAGIAARLGALFALAFILTCGQGGIQVAGGTSEVGNPSNGILVGNRKDEDTASTDIGVQFDFTGTPIRIIKARKPDKQASADDSASASVSDSDSASASDTQTVSDTQTPSPAN